jgi:hypothetical protein
LFLAGCGLIGGGDGDKSTGDTATPTVGVVPPSILTQQAQAATNSPPPTENAQPTPEPSRPTLEPPQPPAVQSFNEARTLLWAYLGRCFTFNPKDLEGHLVGGDWFVRAARTGDPIQEYGLWQVLSSTGALKPQDPLARTWQQFVDEGCSEGPRLVIFPPKPTPAPSPLPTATPVAATPEAANKTVWAYLSRCLSLDIGSLTSSQVLGDWFVTTSAGAPRQAGLWKVDVATGGLEPHDAAAVQLQSYIESGCSAEVFATLFPPTPTVTPTPTAMPTRTPTPTPTPTPVPTATPAPVITSASGAIERLRAHLLPCFPRLGTGDLQAQRDPAFSRFVVHDKGTGDPVYGVWSIGILDGSSHPENDLARRRDRGVASGC